MRILIVGSEGFVGSNLRVRLSDAGYHDVVGVTRSTSAEGLAEAVKASDFIFHLAGVNRPKNESEFGPGNLGITEEICAAIIASGRPIPIVFSSSTQAMSDNPYGRSKLAAEKALQALGEKTGAPAYLFRLTNIFGKWARPNYNSAVATFCHNIARELPIAIHDLTAPLRLVYIDDVVDEFLKLLADPPVSGGLCEVEPVFQTTVGEVAQIIRSFKDSRTSLVIPPVGVGLTRALYSTYVSSLPVESFSYRLPIYADPRGSFAEVLKTPDCGQFSYFTAFPGVTRGEHYHHSKTEKFVVIRGTARFRFRHIQTNQVHLLDVKGGEGHSVETVPGWAHDITNIGEEELIVMLWANEIFDRARPDTIAMKVVT